MAHIKTRTTKDGIKRYTVEIRLKGFPHQTATFSSLLDAKKWVKVTEEKIREVRIKTLMEKVF